MSDPYVVLGVDASDSDEKIKKAYRDLVKKYHPDHYQNNPLSELAEEKMKEVNEAYDTIVKMRTNGSARGGSYGQSASSGDATFSRVRQLLDLGNIQEAQQILEQKSARGAEWHYLMGRVMYQKGWLDEARTHFRTAATIDPRNAEYQQAAAYLDQQAGRGFQQYQRGGMATTDCCLPFLCGAYCCGGSCG